jgi:hypothetical protein
MNIKKNILFILFALFVFASPSNLAANTKSGNNHSVSVGAGVIGAEPGSNDNVTSIEGIFQSSLRTHESEHHSFQKLKNGRKVFINAIFNVSSLSSKFSHSSYILKRGNGFHRSPFYIAYHRLTI